jgi:hypothetical protein
MQTCFCLFVIYFLVLSLSWVEKLGEVGSLLVMEKYRRYYSHAIQFRHYSLITYLKLRRTEYRLGFKYRDRFRN